LKKKSILLLILALFVVGAAGIYQNPKARWRAELCFSKIAGNLPETTWGDLAAATAPRRIVFGPGLSALSVNAGEQGEGPCSMLWKTRLGSFWGRKEDKEPLQVGLKNLLVEEAYFRSETRVRPGDVVFDGGSHLGTFTRFALDQRASLIVAFEPDPVNGACFEKTFKQEIEEGRVVLFQEALWDKVGRLLFSEGDSSVDGMVWQSEMSSRGQPNKLEISATTVDEAVRQLKLERVDLIKLHIEGSERQALIGARSTLVRFKPRILVALDHRANDPDVIPRLILDMVPGYQIQMRGRDQACFFMN
jgi:FkbM family methyltransferase